MTILFLKLIFKKKQNPIVTLKSIIINSDCRKERHAFRNVEDDAGAESLVIKLSSFR